MRITIGKAAIRTVAFTFCVWGLSVFGHSAYLLTKIGLASYAEVVVLEFIFTSPLFLFWFLITLILFYRLEVKRQKVIFSALALLIPTPIFFILFKMVMGVNLFEFYISISLSQIIPILIFAYPFVLRYDDEKKSPEVTLKGTQLENY